MVGNADTTLLEEIEDRPIAGAVERGEFVEAIDRYCDVDVAALVENFDSVTLERLETGDLARQWPGQRAEQRDRAHLRDLCQICRNRVSSTPERSLAR
jgi:hypothetical protein